MLATGWPQPWRGDGAAAAEASSGPPPGGTEAAAIEPLGGGGGGGATVIASTGSRGVESMRRVEEGFVGALTTGGGGVTVIDGGVASWALLVPLPLPLRRSMDEGGGGVPFPLSRCWLPLSCRWLPLSCSCRSSSRCVKVGIRGAKFLGSMYLQRTKQYLCGRLGGMCERCGR